MSVPVGERRVVSVLVADVAASTAIGERLGPERSKFLFDEIVRLMREEVERFGGTVAQLTGDGLLALFGAPVAHEDDSERAVRTALAIREAITRYGDEVGPSYGIELGARVAVNTGPVVVPAREEPPDRLYNALGDTVNVAARLQSHGDLVVGPETARQLGERFLLEPLGELELKGKSALTEAYRVAGEREAPAQAAATPLVGRETELAQLEQVLDDLVEGRGAIVVLSGEPGIGKSRLKTEARERFHERVRFVEGHAVSYGAEIPYWPVRDLLRDWLALGVSEPEARVRLELRTGIAAVLGDEADEAYPFIASVLGLPLDSELERRLHELSRDSVRQQTFDATYRLVCALAQEQPLCLVFEDLHWADEATTALVEALLPASEDAVAIVLSFRAEGDHPTLDLVDRARRRYRHRFLELELTPLSPVAARQLAVASARAELPEQVADLLAERSGGNPFFLEQALRDLIERGALRPLNGGLELADGEAVAVPTLVQEALQARLDRLTREARDVVMTAAVVGRTFEMPLLERLVPAAELRPALSELQRLELVVEDRRRPAPQYRFRHGLVQEVAYRRLVETQRRELHRAVGEALEELHRDSQEEVFGLLAHHYSEADEAERAIRYSLRAADAARALFAEHEALEHYRRALDFLGPIGDHARARETLFKVALTHHQAFDFEQAGRAFVEAFAIEAPPPKRLEPTADVETAHTAGVPAYGWVPSVGGDNVSIEIGRDLYRGLVKVGRDLEVVPDLAESFTVSADGLIYTFRLRDDACWSDGVPVSAPDFVATWLELRDSAGRGASAIADAATSMLADITDARVLGERTVEVQLREPRSYFLHLLAHGMLRPWPRHAVERLGPRWYEHDPLVTNGPFRLVEAGEWGLTLVASANWAGERGNIRSVRTEFVRGGPEARVAAWREGRYDVLFGADSPHDLGEETIAETSPGLAVGYLAFNVDRPPFDDRRVRRAVAQAVDRERLAPTVGRDAYVQSAGRGGFLPPAMPGHSHRVMPPHDAEAARRLLQEATWCSDRRVILGTLESYGAQFGRELSRQLGEVGIDAAVELVDFPSYERFILDVADAWIWAWIADYPDPDGMLGPGFFSEAYASDDVRQVVDRARSEVDRDERLRLYREAERLWLGEDVALIPLLYGHVTTLRRPWIEGVWGNALSISGFAEAVVHR